MPDTDIQPRAISSTHSAYVRRDSPRPPYSSGIIRPNRPNSLSPSTICCGYSSRCSSSVATGMISLSTKSRTVDRISCWTSVRPAVWARRAMAYFPCSLSSGRPGCSPPRSLMYVSVGTITLRRNTQTRVPSCL
ncbi:hypothetical protein SALBM217S_05352 [Streptomyces griseoloalbus]